MRAVLQRVTSASVSVDGQTVGAIGRGFLVLLGVAPEDTKAEAEMLWQKIFRLRVFADEAGKMNKALSDVGGSVLTVSQFTLFANYKKGNRPDFFGSAAPAVAVPLYEYFLSLVKKDIPDAENGVFGADMAVSLVNDGPVTIALDTDVMKQKGGNQT